MAARMTGPWSDGFDSECVIVQYTENSHIRILLNVIVEMNRRFRIIVKVEIIFPLALGESKSIGLIIFFSLYLIVICFSMWFMKC